MKFKYTPISLANRVKRSVKRVTKYIPDFESAAINHAISQDYEYVVCGHIHLPQLRAIPDNNLPYINAGDWVENLSALAHRNKKWSSINTMPSITSCEIHDCI